MDFPEVYVSFAWGDDSNEGKKRQEVVERLCTAFEKRKYTLHIDRVDIEYKGSIKEYMKKIGTGSFIVLIISDKYLKSKYCMFEVLEMLKYPELKKRIFPIVLDDAKIRNAIDIIDYITYWENKTDELNRKIKMLSNMAYAAPIYEEINLFNEIRRVISNFTEIISDMNTLKVETFLNSDFEPIFNAIANSKN